MDKKCAGWANKSGQSYEYSLWWGDFDEILETTEDFIIRMVAISGRGTRVASNKSVFMFRSESIPGPRVLPIFSCYFVLRLVGGYSRALCVQMCCIWSDCFWCVDVLFVVREITFRIFVVAWLSCCVLAMPIDFVMGVRMVSTTETIRPAQRKTNNKSTTKLLYGPLYKLLPLPSTSSTLDESEMGCSKTLRVELLSLNGGTRTWRACILGCSFLMCSATLPWIFMISSICMDLQLFHICATCHRISLICIQLTRFRAF